MYKRQADAVIAFIGCVLCGVIEHSLTCVACARMSAAAWWIQVPAAEMKMRRPQGPCVALQLLTYVHVAVTEIASRSGPQWL